MELKKGWAPLPVMLKIIWILLLIGVVFSIPALFTASAAGYTLFGKTVYGLWAANLMFLVNLLLPIFLIIAMMKRYTWTWIYGVGLYLVMIANELLMLSTISEVVSVVLNELPEEYFDILPNIPEIVHASVVAGIIFGALTDLFFLLVFVLTRKYFSHPEDKRSADLPEGNA